MKSPLFALVVLIAAAGTFVGAIFFSHDADAPPVRTAVASLETDEASDEPHTETSSPKGEPAAEILQNGFMPPNPEPDIDPEFLRRESESLKQSVPENLVPSLQRDPPAEFQDDERLAGMVWIPGGVFVMGNNDGAPDEAPRHPVAVDGFWMDAMEVTNRKFQKFIEATNYVTTSERKPELRSIQPGSNLEQVAILEEFNRPGSICSLPLSSREEIDPEKGAYSWWQYVPGANWKHPEGPDSSIQDRMDHPVVHLSWLDVQEYCRWAGTTLPTEAQWEYAARGGHEGRVYPWGNKRNPSGKWLQNIWQGEFPVQDTAEDGFGSTAPVGSFEPNDYGLYDMSGNVWEWCLDYYHPTYYRDSPLRNPRGPARSFDPQEPGIIKRVQRGGSFMCSDQYCIGYRVAARMKGEEDTGAFHTGFRCVVTPDMLPRVKS